MSDVRHNPNERAVAFKSINEQAGSHHSVYTLVYIGNNDKTRRGVGQFYLMDI